MNILWVIDMHIKTMYGMMVVRKISNDYEVWLKRHFGKCLCSFLIFLSLSMDLKNQNKIYVQFLNTSSVHLTQLLMRHEILMPIFCYILLVAHCASLLILDEFVYHNDILVKISYMRKVYLKVSRPVYGDGMLNREALWYYVTDWFEGACMVINE